MRQILVLNDVRKSYGDKAVLADVTLAFLPGAKIGVVGPNGTGKSTLLRLMAGLEEPSCGEVLRMPGRSAGILPQEPPLDDAKTVLAMSRPVPPGPGNCWSASARSRPGWPWIAPGNCWTRWASFRCGWTT